MTAIYPVCLILLPLGFLASLPEGGDPRLLSLLSLAAAAVSFRDLSPKKTVWIPVLSAIVLSSCYAVTLDGRLLPFLFALALLSSLTVSRLLPPLPLSRPLAFSVYALGIAAGRLTAGGSALSRQLQTALAAVVLVTGLFTLLSLRFSQSGSRPLSLLPLSLLSALLFPSLPWYLFLLPAAGCWLTLSGPKATALGGALGIAGLFTTSPLVLLALGMTDTPLCVSLPLAALSAFLPLRVSALIFFLFVLLGAFVDLRRRRAPINN